MKALDFALMVLTGFVIIGNHLSTPALPEYLHVCSRMDLDMVKCINNSVNHLKPKLEAGIPELNLPPLEPLRLQEIQLRRGPNGAAINANITDLEVWGPANFIITDLQPNLQKNTFYFKVWCPHLYFKGKYELDIKILLIETRGKGPLQGNFTDFHCETLMQGKIKVKNEVEYIKFSNPKLRLDIGRAEIKLHNLFESDPLLRQVFDDVLNENSDVFINEIKPGLENALVKKFEEIAEKITSQFPYQELFP